jgi:hypothetical protein
MPGLDSKKKYKIAFEIRLFNTEEFLMNPNNFIILAVVPMDQGLSKDFSHCIQIGSIFGPMGCMTA